MIDILRQTSYEEKMKKLALILLVLIFTSCNAATTVTPGPSPTPSASFGPVPTPAPAPTSVTLLLTWQAPVETPMQITQYNVYMSLTPGNENPVTATPVCQVVVPGTSCTTPLPTYLAEYFIVTSVNTSFTPAIQSIPSNEIEVLYPLPSPAPSGVQTKGLSATILVP